MSIAAYLLIAFGIGFGSALQTGMISAIARSKGPTEAAWISLLATLCGLALIFGLRALYDDPPALAGPFTSPWTYLVVGAFGVAALWMAMHGLNPVLAIAGMFGFGYLLGAAFLAPRIGIALFASAITAGTLIGSVALDHIGPFGIEVHRIGLLRIIGVLMLVGGVVLVRFSP